VTLGVQLSKKKRGAEQKLKSNYRRGCQPENKGCS